MRQRERIVKVLMCVCLVLALAASSLATRGFASENNVKPRGMHENAAPAAKEDSTLASRKEKLSYALGMVLGTQLRKQSIEVDPDLYHQGLKDALAGGRTLLTETEARAAVQELQQELKKERPGAQATGASTEINVSFKLDPRITQGSYMGERWVSPPTYTTVQEGKTGTVDARAVGVGAKRKRKKGKLSPRWIPADPEMVTVSPSVGNQVKITVLRDGESKLKVAVPGAFRELTIKAAYQDNAIRVDISQ
jgi:hypothetical protein